MTMSIPGSAKRLLKDKNVKDLITGSSFALFFRLANFAFGFLLVVLISHSFGAATLGAFVLASTIVTICGVLSRVGFDTALVRFVVENVVTDRHDIATAVFKKARALVLVISLVISITLYFLAPSISEKLFHNESLQVYVELAAIAVPLLALSYLYAAFLRGLNKIKEFAFIQNAAVNLFAVVVLAILLVFSSNDLLPLIAYVAAIAMTLLTSIWLGTRHASNTATRDVMSLREMLKVSLPLLLASSMSMVLGWTDIILLGVFRSEAEVGVYSVVMKLAMVTIVILRAVNGALAPKLAGLHKAGDLAGMQWIVEQSTKLIFWTSLPILLLLLLLPTPILSIFSSEFISGRDALLFLTIGMFVEAISGSVGSILQMTNRQHVFLNIVLGTTILNVVLNLVLIPPYGIEGAAIASMVSIISRNIAMVFYIRRSLGILTIYFPGLIKKDPLISRGHSSSAIKPRGQQ